MKAKLEIPKGWRRLKVGELVKAGDRQLNIEECVFSWNLLTSFYLSCYNEPIKAMQYDCSQIIRKVKK